MTRFVVDGFEVASVEYQFILAHPHALAAQVVDGALGGEFVGDLHLVGALEVAMAQHFCHTEVHHIERVVHKHHCGVVDGSRLHAKHHIFAFLHLIFEFTPTYGVGELADILYGEYRFFLKHLFVRDVFLVAVKLYVVDKFYRIRLIAATALIIGLAPLYGDVAAQKFLSSSVFGYIVRQCDLRIGEVIELIVV